MTAMKATKKAMLSSLLALVLCFAMLLGTTFAWFTDSAVSSDNKIKAGTLDVQLYKWTGTDASEEITTSSDPLFTEDTIWEPGRTEVVYLSIKNNGSLDLKYKVALDTKAVSDHDLREVMSYAITPDAKYGDVTGWLQNGETEETLDTEEAITVATENVALEAGAEHFFALSVHMDEEAGNEYMGDNITFDIKVLAGQLASEEDGFGNPNYDEFAEYPGTGFAPALIDGQTGVEITVVDDEGYKVGSVLIPAGAVEDTTKGISASIVPSTYKANITVAAGMETTAYDVSVSNLKDGNTAEIKAQLRIAAGLDPATVTLYHYDTEIPCTYDPYTGYVTFETTDFSPFTVVYDADSEYEAPSTEEVQPPKAIITYMPEYVGEDKVGEGEGKIHWGSFGGWAPSADCDAYLEAAFKYECPELTDAQREAYAYWLCDFYVSLDRELGAIGEDGKQKTNEIFLGGYYASFGAWVGFHSADLKLAANQELPLLGTAIGNGESNWKYSEIESIVDEFICGVCDVNDALEGATFTVKLRLTNPEDSTDFIDVNTVTYKFGGNVTIDGTTVVTTGEGLQDAINNGDTNISLGGDIDLSEGLVIPGNN